MNISSYPKEINVENNILPPINQCQRQIHLDFHTSPYIPKVAEDFDPLEFATCMKESNVNSVTVFSKCHHGMSYYPTKIGEQHPGCNGRDLLGEMIEALHRVGIRTPIYTTVGWEEKVAHDHPEWRQMKKDWSFADLEGGSDWVTKQPGGWKFNNFLHPDYQDYIEAHLLELFNNYEVDGFFMDIMFFHPKGGWSKTSRKFKEKHGILADTLENHQLFEHLAQEQFAQRFTKLIQDHVPKANIFYNAANNRYSDGKEGIFRRSPHQTHFEIESLPSGFWGYYHFPRIARHLAHKGKYWFGMTGKFLKMWGDFGGLKTQAALEYECFRAQAFGGGNSIGDQLSPKGKLDHDTYKVIGNVYKQISEAEGFYKDSEAIHEVGILCPNAIHFDENETAKSEEGIVLLMEELHYECAVLDDESDLEKYEVIILPDTVVITDNLKHKLEQYYTNGGKIILSYKSGFNKSNEWVLNFLPIIPKDEVELFPTYWKFTNEMPNCKRKNEYVFYQSGMNVVSLNGNKVFVNRVLPYFRRTDLTFCSHFHTPPNEVDHDHPAVVGDDNFIYFADPIFKEYRQAGSEYLRDGLSQLMIKFIGKSKFGRGLSSHILAVPRKKDNNLMLTLLNYIPVRKAIDIDIIEQGMTFLGEELELEGVEVVYCHSTNEYLLSDNGKFILPNVKGRLLLEVKNYFN